jgi:hypothetical protein
MNRLQRIIGKKQMIFPYINKYGHIYGNLFKYKLEKLIGYDPLKALTTKLAKRYRLNSNEGAKNFIRKHMKMSLLCSDLNEAILELRRDEAFMAKLRETADCVGMNRFLILGKYWDNVYEEATGHFRWQTDIKAGYTFVLSHYSQARKKNRVSGVDIKNVWELSRLQYLFAPALLWRITGEKKYAELAQKVINDWIRCNRLEEGPNWNLAMEAGIRIANILLAFQLIGNYGELDENFCLALLASAYQHLMFIIRNEENVGGRTSNHYLGGLLGIFCVSCTFPFLPSAAEFTKYAAAAFEREIQKQILDDGGDFEGSTAYQRLVGEMFSIVAVVGKNCNINLSQAFHNRLYNAVKYAYSLQKPNNTMPQIGDNDGGHVFQLTDGNPLSNNFFINLGYYAVTGKLYKKDCAKEIMCFTGIGTDTGIDENLQTKNIALFGDSRQALYKDESLYCLLGAGDAHRFTMGGHTHNDKLSFELCFMGREFIIDPGTGNYTAFPSLRNQLRSVKSHSTISINSCEQNRFQYNRLFNLNYDTTTIINVKNITSAIVSLSGEITTKFADKKYVHRRDLRISKSQREITIIDNFDIPHGSTLTWRFVTHPEVRINIDGKTAELINGDVRILVDAFANLRLEEGVYSQNYGEWERTNILYFEDQYLEPEKNFIIKIIFN